jgi:arylamine N-acetyltransferase
MGIAGDVPVSANGLFEVYAAWCRKVPFDNIRKIIDLIEGGRLCGLSAAEFFENWLEHGTGGTCWPSSNALRTLLRSLGFDARRVAGSMYDLGTINHGTVKVRIDGEDWLADTCMLTHRPIPVNGEIFIDNSKEARIEVEPDGESHIIWYDFVPSPVYVPCRLHLDPADAALYKERYEVFSREYSPFNDRLYFRTGGPDGASLILGNVRFRRTDDGVEIQEFTKDGLCEHLASAGVSGDIVERWISAGGLERSFDPSNIRPAPEITGVRPSLRRHNDNVM